MNYGVATADGGMLAHKGETMNVTLTEAQAMTKQPSVLIPARCRFCGAQRTRDTVGHRCPTHNCQWEHGYSTCTLHEKVKDA